MRGLQENQISALIDRYDSGRSGKCSFEDFLIYVKDYELPKLNGGNTHLKQRFEVTKQGVSVFGDEDSLSEEPSLVDSSNPRELEYRLKIFLTNFKAYLVKQALETSRTRAIGGIRTILQIYIN